MVPRKSKQQKGEKSTRINITNLRQILPNVSWCLSIYRYSQEKNLKINKKAYSETVLKIILLLHILLLLFYYYVCTFCFTFYQLQEVSAIMAEFDLCLYESLCKKKMKRHKSKKRWTFLSFSANITQLWAELAEQRSGVTKGQWANLKRLVPS